MKVTLNNINPKPLSTSIYPFRNKKRKQKHTNKQVKKNKYKQATTKKETKGENKKKKKQTNKRNKTKHKNTSSVLNQMTPFINGKYFYMMIQMTIK
jgi:cation transport ATPase